MLHALFVSLQINMPYVIVLACASVATDMQVIIDGLSPVWMEGLDPKSKN